MIHTLKDMAWIVLASGAVVSSMPGGGDMGPAVVVRHMVAAADAFLSSLAPAQHDKVSFSFDDGERFDWHYIPRDRAGLALKEMNEDQRRLAQLFLEAGLSGRGFWKATTIMELESVLREMEGSQRDPGNYHFSVFGKPSAEGIWGWRVEGHHLSLNLTVVEGRLIADAPRFLGANPAEVTHGPLGGTRVLQKEEDLARALIRSLDDARRAQALFQDRAPRDIVTGNRATVDPPVPEGIRASDLTDRQMDKLLELIEVYASAVPDDIARRRMARVQKAGSGHLYFGWAGGLDPGVPHYYRIQGPDFMIEYDNVQNEANHIHTVWRDFDGDFGRDLLREHYRQAHGG